MPRAIVWTEEMELRLRSLFTGGALIPEIASEIGVSQSSVERKIRNLGIVNRKRRWSQNDVDEMRAMMSSGKSLGEIADSIGRTTSAVRSKLTNLGDGSGRRFWTEKEEGFLIFNAHRMSKAKIAKELRRTVGAVELRMWRLGVTSSQGIRVLTDAAREMKIPHTTVWRRLKKIEKEGGFRVQKRSTGLHISDRMMLRLVSSFLDDPPMRGPALKVTANHLRGLRDYYTEMDEADEDRRGGRR